MKLNLKNPIVFFDLETTGTNINSDRIVEICYLKVYPNGNEESKTLRINPEMPIPAESSAVHGIYDADVADCPTFKEVAKSIANDIEGCDLAGFNSNRFDIPVLAEEFLRAGVDIDMSKRKFVDVQVIFHKMEQRTLTAAYKFYCGRNLEDAHTAEADTRATYEVLMAQLDRYPEELQNDMSFLADYSSYNKNVDFAGRMVYDDNGVEVFNFGKYKGQSVSEVLKKDPGYYSWILNSDFTLNTKAMLTKIRLLTSHRFTSMLDSLTSWFAEISIISSSISDMSDFSTLHGIPAGKLSRYSLSVIWHIAWYLRSPDIRRY